MKELLLTAVEQFGAPLYVYDIEQIKANITELRDSLGEDVEIHYAVKALTNTSVLREIRAAGCGVDAVSIEEMQISLRAGFTPEEINFTPSGAHFDEYVWAIEKGINIHIDNPGILKKIGELYPGADISIRINPSIRTGGHVQLQVGADDSKFGLFPEEFDHVHSIIKETGLTVKRVHVHAGSDIKTEDDFEACWKKAFDFALRYKESVDVVDLGGGFGVQYFPGDPILNLYKLGRLLDGLREDYRNNAGRSVRVMIEPGKSIVGNAGYFLVEVTATKELDGRRMAYVNSGFNHLIRPMYYGARHRIENISSADRPEYDYAVVGYLCETDTFSNSVLMPTIKTGDILLMHNAGAYAMTMASNYNSRVRPAEAMIKDGQLTLIRRRETLDDYLGAEVATSTTELS